MTVNSKQSVLSFNCLVRMTAGTATFIVVLSKEKENTKNLVCSINKIPILICQSSKPLSAQKFFVCCVMRQVRINRYFFVGG